MAEQPDPGDASAGMTYADTAAVLRQLAADAAQTEACLEEALQACRLGASMFSGADRLADAMAYAVLGGGKRLRAGLVLTAARFAADGTPPDGVARVAAAYECLHGYSLIHDDLPAMDDAETRRGKPACHLAFDEATAILAGDALQSLAFSLLANPATHTDAAVRARLVEQLADAAGANGMAGGQMLDLQAEKTRFTTAQIRHMQNLKTGALIRAATLAGATHAGAGPEMMDGLDRYARAVGEAFQIADDLLDAEGSSGQLGKPVGRDAAAGKASLVQAAGAAAARDHAAALVAEAAAALDCISGGEPADRTALLDLAGFVITRRY